MKKAIIAICVLLISNCLSGQQHKVMGIVLDSLIGDVVAGATIVLNSGAKTEITDELGRFVFVDAAGSAPHLSVSGIGFQKRMVDVIPGSGLQVIKLLRNQTKLLDVIVSASAKNPYKVLAETDIEMRGVANSQEVLRMVPGLFIGQHQGGGKAEQIFLRGFDADHGTDVSIHADGIPVNLVSHAHAQGYADSHFIIPETISQATFNKGPYDAEKGDQATAGYLDFNTHNTLPGNTIKLEGGEFKTFRVLAMINLFGDKKPEGKASWYAASEYNYSNSYFDNPQHFKRYNLFTKFNYKFSTGQLLSLSASTFWSDWRASGQIPERAVDSGLVGYYGALDPNEGGATSRTNLNLQLRSLLVNGDIVKNQLYYSHYSIDLHSNFTFFLDDPINGDEIRQREGRNLFGYNGSWVHEGYLDAIKFTTQAGINLRMDATNNTELAHTRDRYTLLNLVKLGNIAEIGSGFYLAETLKLTERLHIKGGLRFDRFHYHYDNKLANDKTLNGAGIYKAANHVFSPKVSTFYQADPKAQVYLSVGKGFHTNDARVTVAEPGKRTIPSAYGTDLGVVYKPFKSMLLQAAVWYMYLQNEFVYAGDGGTIEFNGPTRRVGFDLSARYQPEQQVFVDLDFNFARGRAVGKEKGKNYIPLAPLASSSGGVTFIIKEGWNASFRYRYLSKRPANMDYSLTCEGYFVNDLLIRHRSQKWEYGFIINNVFGVKWKETQFATVTRLKGEQTDVDDITFTPGTKFNTKISCSYFFRTGRK